jgi:hypothetical protein
MRDGWTLDRALQVGIRLHNRPPAPLTPLEVWELGEVLAFLTTEQQTTLPQIADLHATVGDLCAQIAGLQETIHALVTANIALRAPRSG